MIGLEIFFKGQTQLDIDLLWENALESLFERRFDAPIFDAFTGGKITHSTLKRFLVENASGGFDIETTDSQISFGFIANSNLSRLDIRVKVFDCKEIDEFMLHVSSLDNFQQARLYDCEYDMWQNMSDISYYENESRSHSHLLKMSNGLPFPLEKEVIDVSKNLGSRIYNTGFVDVVGSVMWLNSHFLKDLGVDIKTSRGLSDEVSISKHEDVYRLKIQDKCFTSDQGVEGEKQAFLKNALFKKTQE